MNSDQQGWPRPDGWAAPEPGWQPSGGAFPPGGGWPPPPPPRRRRTGLIVGLSVVVAVVALGGLLVLIGASGGHKPVAAVTPATPASQAPAGPAAARRSLRVPKSFAGYVRMSGDVADRVVASMRKAAVVPGMNAGSNRAMAAKLKIGIYRRVAEPELFFIGFAAGDSPAFEKELRSTPPSEEIDSMFLTGGISHTKDYPAGPLGGVLRCGRGTLSGLKVTGCGWADRSVAVMVLDTRVAKPATLAGIARRLRSVAEH